MPSLNPMLVGVQPLLVAFPKAQTVEVQNRKIAYLHTESTCVRCQISHYAESGKTLASLSSNDAIPVTVVNEVKFGFCKGEKGTRAVSSYNTGRVEGSVLVADDW
ncbi:hypothetical protein LY76DRAFT_643496 [Colletotrichum caudatum]|nr:hypothetical protein LY76DRAFT_643496 [Colletotrichum caudatum]